MKLELFDFIEETLYYIEERKESIEEVANTLEKFFTDSFFINDHFLNVNYRIKSEESLREKILRDNFYIKYKTPENLINNLSDLIGFRIECRFIEDEKKIYNDIVRLFKIKEDDGFYSSQLNSNIMLQLDKKQPQIQKNGFEIYKLEGKYSKDDININFELQIKSLVNVFWGEIDHRVLYKNFNYMLTEDFFRDIMSSIKDNLSMIDRQLMLVFDHLNGMDASNSNTKKVQLKALLSKIIHDIYIVKVRQEIGFVVDFKKSTDVIVDYIFMNGGHEESDKYSKNFIRVLNRLDDIGKEDSVFNKYIDFHTEICFNDDFTRKIGNNIIAIINKDFRWNLFFRIIFDIELGSMAEVFERFMIFIRSRLDEKIIEILEEKHMTKKEKETVVSHILEYIGENFSENLDVNFLCSFNIDKLNKEIIESFMEILTYEDWLEKQGDIKNIILNHKI